MVIAWCFLIPIAIIVARYFKVMPKQDWPTNLDNKFWWFVHRYFNIFATLISFVGMYLIVENNRYIGEFRSLHAVSGWLVIFLCCIQLLTTCFRGTKGGPTSPRINSQGVVIDLFGDHYYMTSKRIIFEYLHKSLGHILWLLALIVIFLGLLVADAPRWMFISIVFWWACLLLCSIFLQVNERCIDTYQAIWGVDKNLPGSISAPIGWGVNRIGDD
jgi:hypothetical protein